jgi:hypothetical protein
MRTAVTGDGDIVVAAKRTGPDTAAFGVGALTLTVNGTVGADTLTDVVADAESPTLSFTVPLTVNVPALL